VAAARAIRRRHKARLAAAKLGRSRGGLTTKVHIAAEGRCRPVSIVVTAGQAGDSPQFQPVLSKIRVRSGRGGPGRRRPDAVLADKAYSSKGNRSYLRKRNIKTVIPEKADQAAARKRKGAAGGRPVSFDAELYKLRNTAERCFNRLKQWRGVALRTDKLAESYEAAVTLASIMLWIRSS
jgi:transposase